MVKYFFSKLCHCYFFQRLSSLYFEFTSQLYQTTGLTSLYLQSSSGSLEKNTPVKMLKFNVSKPSCSVLVTKK